MVMHCTQAVRDANSLSNDFRNAWSYTSSYEQEQARGIHLTGMNRNVCGLKFTSVIGECLCKNVCPEFLVRLLLLSLYFCYSVVTVDKSLVPVAARSKAYVCGHFPPQIVVSNPTGGMNVCLL
jgi:hypothetical protein